MPGQVLHRSVKMDARRVRVQANRTLKLDASLRIGRASQLDFATLSFRKLSKGKWPIVQQVRASCPMLLVVVPFRQQPDLVAPIVEPFADIGREIFSGELGIHEQVGMSSERDLH